jgi:signal transduction histidine kinase
LCLFRPTRGRDFVVDASHELRTPLTILQTPVQLVRRRAGNPGLRQDFDRLVDDTRALNEIVNDLAGAENDDFHIDRGGIQSTDIVIRCKLSGLQRGLD